MQSVPEKTLIVLGGPTASGKTALAIRLALHFGTEILSADSRQFYREMSVGTAKPSPEELAQVKHHFIDSLSIHDSYSVGDFEREALAVLKDLFARRDIAIVTGGSGLFLKALCEGLDEFPEVPLSVRDGVEALYREEGLAGLQRELQQADPVYYGEVDLHNPHRLIRALSVCRASGLPFSAFRKKQVAERAFRPVFIELAWERSELYQRINRRVEKMLEKGLIDEARALFPWKNLPALQTVGYQELFSFFSGEITLPEAVELIQRNSRRYAKRQLTWSRRSGSWKHFHPSEWSDILHYLDFSMKEVISWSQPAFSEQTDAGFRQGMRLELKKRGRLSGYLDFRTTHKGVFLLPVPFPEFPYARWLLHELVWRAEGESITAFLGVEWESLLRDFRFLPLPAESLNTWEKELFKQFPNTRPWKKTGSDLIYK